MSFSVLKRKNVLLTLQGMVNYMYMLNIMYFFIPDFKLGNLFIEQKQIFNILIENTKINVYNIQNTLL